MDRIHYAGHSVLTGTAIAQALLDYAQALAEAGGSATVDFPILNEDGSRGRSEILIGPSSQIISDAEESEHDDLVDEELVARMVDQADRLRKYGVSTATADLRGRDPVGDWNGYEL